MSQPTQLNLFEDALPGETPTPPTQFAEVVFNRPLDHAYTYGVPNAFRDEIAVGKRVQVPFGRGDKPVIGFCVGLTETVPERDVKRILRVLDEEALLTPALLRLTRWMADYYLCGWGQVLNAVVPAGAKQKAGTKNLISIELVPEAFWPRPMPNLSSKQKTVLEILGLHLDGLEIHDLARQANCAIGPIRGLVSKGIAKRVVSRVENEAVQRDEQDEPQAAPTPGPELTPDQLHVWAQLEPALRSGGFRTFLLHGVTGSGKTEIYLRAIEEVLRQGKEALVLVPEISLTPQTIQAFRGRCGGVAVLHSHLQRAERGGHWRKIFSGRVQVVVGARSGVFAPARRLGLIVIDEEHEASFKQETTPRYHARDVAIMRARLENIPILLGSATPSLESWHNADKGQYTRLTLPKRVLDRPLPQVHLIDLRHDRHKDKRLHGISPSLETAMKSALKEGGQIILLLNRRGYSTYLFCPACGHVEQCKFCDLALIYHKEENVALCHYCGFEEKPPRVCPDCGMRQVLYQGIGTEKLEAELKSHFASATVARMDSDTMRRPGSHRKVFDAFKRGEIDILMGTQMIAKGLDFPNVTLVGVVNADVSLHHADFRAPERTFQLLAQVSGRTGRGPRGGKVLVQSFCPEHPSIALASSHDYVAFATKELRDRLAHHYPPFQRMARLILRGKNREETSDFADRLAGAFGPALESLKRQGNQAQELRILGPAEAPVVRLKGYFRFHFQLQSPSSAFLHEVLRQVLPAVKLPANVEMTVDIDPQDML